MSRSCRHKPIFGPRCAPQRLSEADDKAKCARRFRHAVKQALSMGDEDPPDNEYEFGDRWNMRKDGKYYHRNWKCLRWVDDGIEVVDMDPVDIKMAMRK